MALVNTSKGSVFKPLSSIQTDPLRNFRFLVEFLPHTYTSGNDNSKVPGFKPSAAVGFVGVSGLTVTTESIAYREGGYNTTMHQFPGQTSFQPITFTRGVIMGTNQHHDWMKELFAVISGTSPTGVGTDFRCEIDITVLSHPNPGEWKSSDGSKASKPDDLHAAAKFRVYNAWITQLQYGDLSAGGNDLLVESMTVVHEGWDMVWAKDYTASADSTKFIA